jgi:hypothetical protein
VIILDLLHQKQCLQKKSIIVANGGALLELRGNEKTGLVEDANYPQESSDAIVKLIDN